MSSAGLSVADSQQTTAEVLSNSPRSQAIEKETRPAARGLSDPRQLLWLAASLLYASVSPLPHCVT